MITVLVTGIGGGGVGEQLIKALKSSTLKYEIIGTDITNISKGFNEVDYAYIVPKANHLDYAKSILDICQKHDVKAIFPGSEIEIKSFNENRLMFEKSGVKLFINKQDVLDISFDKNKTVEFLTANNFCFPKTFVINNIADIDDIDLFPLVLKPSIGGGGSANVMLAQNKDELKLFAALLLNIYTEFIAQEYVGTPEHEYTVGVLFDGEGNYINAIALKRSLQGGLNVRLRAPNNSSNKSLGSQLVISSGISQGEFGKFQEVLDQCIAIAKKLRATYAVNLQCRLVDGKVYLFEINPRFSGTTSLRAMVGYNEPDVLLRKYFLNEEPVVNFEYRYAKIVRGLKEEIFF